MLIAQTILIVVSVYLLCGLAAGVPFVLRGVDRIDPAARGTSLGFRLVILPGTITLWPLLIARWIRVVQEVKPQ